MHAPMIGIIVLAGLAGESELTIYNQGFALVKETRDFRLSAGRQQVRVEDVAQMIEPNSVAIKSLTRPGSFSVLEQNYQYDLISAAAILNKAVGGTVVFNRVLPNGTKERIVGTLLSAPTAIVGNENGGMGMVYNGMVIESEGRILLNPSGEIEVSSLPEGLISKPTLMWEIESEAAGTNRAELSYITQGMSWKSDYVLSLDEAGRIGDLKGWVTLTNNSGATWKAAKLKLLAGEVFRDSGPRGGRPGAAMDAMKQMQSGGFSEEQFSEYHLYTLQRPTDVRNKEMKQVSLLEAERVPVEKKLVLDPLRGYGYYQPGEGEVGTGNLKPLVLIEFKNDEPSHLGMPLPMGTIKVFQRDSSGSLQMLGEASIDHTPRNEKLSLPVGRSFDIVGERKRTKFEWIYRGGDRRGTRETFDIEIRNRKKTAERVYLIERTWMENKVTQKSMEFSKLDSNTMQFVVDLAADETKTVSYTIETYW